MFAALQMAVKCKPCLNQFHSMINNCRFKKSVDVYLIVTEKNKSINKICAQDMYSTIFMYGNRALQNRKKWFTTVSC